MKRLFSWLGVMVFAGAVLLPASLQASNFVFTNNNILISNSVTAFSVNPSDGVLTKLGTTGTDGAGCGGGVYAPNRIITSPDGKYLYVSNDGSDNITIFRVNKWTGAITPVGSPAATGNTSGCTTPNGMSLAVTPGGDFLYAATRNSQNIRIFSVAKNGTLSQVGGLVPLPGTPDSIKVRRDGKFLAAGLFSSNNVAMFCIGPSGTLAVVPGSPFASGGPGYPSGVAGVDFNPRGDLLFGGQANFGATIVDVFGVGRNGTLSPVTGSPFTFDLGTSNSNVVLDPSGHILYASNQDSSSVIDFIVGPNGALTLGANQPVSLGSNVFPVGMAVNTLFSYDLGTQTFLYVADYHYSQVFVFTVDYDGTLTAVHGSPFATGEGDETGLYSLAVDSPAAE
jgi:6-phosphogluconolactonase (cycloisomerase 2 family)